MTEKQIEQLLKDYHWMINSLKIMREGINDIGEGLIAQYGLEASMQKQVVVILTKFTGSLHGGKNGGKRLLTMNRKSKRFRN